MFRYIIYILCFLSLPLTTYAQIEVFLSSWERGYHPHIWTSDQDPDDTRLGFHYRYAREDISSSFYLTEEVQQARILDLFSDRELDERIIYYQSLRDFSRDGLMNYLALTLNSDIDDHIGDKVSLWRTLTPFESVFQTCGIPLSERRDITRTLIEAIHNREFEIIDDIEYSDKSFWDCIIPFPDSRRSPAHILTLPNTFDSNRYIALTRQNSNNFLRFTEAREQDVALLSGSSFTHIQDLNIDSQRLESHLTVDKSHGRNRLAYVHKNHFINPFRNANIVWNQVGWQNYLASAPVSWTFQAWHSLYISEGDSEEVRTLQDWRELRPGIYHKLVLQEDTFESDGSPRQHVWATSYYAIVYNHDITAPLCGATLLSHDSLWYERFELAEGESNWFNEPKYAYFVCQDPESGCLCDSSMDDCFVRDGYTMSSPQALPHLWNVSYSFQNHAWKTQTCVTSSSDQLRYDFTSPDMSISVLSDPDREYVSNDGVLYDGSQVIGKRYYNISEITELEAGDVDIDFQIYDPHPSLWGQARSWLARVRVEVSQRVSGVWESIWEMSEDDVEGQELYELSLETINTDVSGRNIVEQAGRYQLMFYIEDRAGNTARIIWQYRILPGPIDTSMSLLEIPERNTSLANSEDYYEYTLTLRDSFSNPVAWKQVVNIAHSCTWSTSECRVIRTNMIWNPSWNEALRIVPVGSWISNDDGQIFFQVRSLAPGQFTERFEVSFQDPSETHIFSSHEENIFLKPLTWTLETYDTSEWYDDRLFVWEEREYRVRATMTWVTVSPSFELIWEIRGRHPDTSFSGSVTSSSLYTGFTGVFDSSLPELEAHKTLLEIVDNVDNTVSWIIVSYEFFSWEEISYRLSSDALSNNPLILTDTRELDRPVRLIGGLQADGNIHNPNERQNISEINSYGERTRFRRNIAEHIMRRTHNTTVWRVKYIDLTSSGNKNYILESHPNFDTLIVRNGNIVISQDFNTSWGVIWLISYIDNGYSVESWYSAVWNIYVGPDVGRINAFIYADGGLISTDNSWNPFSDISLRDASLAAQLHIRGLLFTRNTLAGWRELDGLYMLPGRREIAENSANQDLARQYDLYYTRRGNDGCEIDDYWFCNIPQYLIIEYDARIVSNPPPLFSR